MEEIEKQIEKLELELKELKESNLWAAEHYGSELCAGDMMGRERKLEEKIKKLKIQHSMENPYTAPAGITQFPSGRLCYMNMDEPELKLKTKHKLEWTSGLVYDCPMPKDFHHQVTSSGSSTIFFDSFQKCNNINNIAVGVITNSFVNDLRNKLK